MTKNKAGGRSLAIARQGRKTKWFAKIHHSRRVQLGTVRLSIVYPAKPDEDDYTDEEIAMFGKIHKERIKLSDAILVVNVDHYIGNSTESEIEFARSLNKEIIYYTDLVK